MRAPNAYILFMSISPLPADPTLDEIRTALAPLIARNAGFDGWSDAAVHAAADEAGVDRDVAKLAFKDNAIDMIDAWIDSIDLELAHRLPAEKLAAMKIRDRITALLATRLEIMAPDRESLRRAMAIMAMPQNLVRSAKIGWRSADRMWRLAGDTASDFNHYTKRMTLSAVYASTLSVFVNDDSDNFADARAFLDRRIDNVMQFEKVKFQAKQRQDYVPSLSRFIGRLRYPAR
ncbi:COQ9 family protein [Sphingorhabdus rigui]